MKTWIIFDRNGLAKCEAHKLEYSGEFLGACSVNVDITSPTPIGFEIGDYLEYRGERFEMNYDPSVVKQASAGAHGESFLYSGVVFNALSDELTRCEFLDYVPSDNEMHYSSLPTFSFFAENVKVLAERIQVNLDRIYTGAKKWSVNIHGERTEAKNVNVTISNQSCWDALGLVKTLFGENFIVRGRTITIGTSGIVMGSTLTYGKGNGLCKIERNAESNQKIITRLRAYGSTRNMSPAYYRSLGMQVFGEVIWIVDREATDHLKCYLNIPYEEGLFADNGNVTVKINGVEASATITKHEVKDEFEGCCVLYAASPELFAVTQDGMKAYFTSGVNKHRFPHSNKEYLENVPNNMAVMHLMLPSFPNETLDPYLDSKHIDVLGVREGTVFFDGSNGLEEIYPTMEGMTAEDLKASGVDVKAEGNLDEVVSAELIEDDGVLDNVSEIPPFQITLKDIGFDINQYLGTSQPAISMKDGMCGGREFEIQSCKKEGSNYVLTCNRSEDSSLGLFFPYKDYPIQTGDKFVLLNLEMPDVYVQAASQRLLKAAHDYLKKHDYVRYSYIPSVDNIYMARQHDEAIANGGVSIHDTIKEGDFLLFEDEDLGIKGSVTISSLRIKEDTSSSLIPEYDIVLQEEKTLGTIERIQNQINNIEAGGVVGSVNTEQVQGIVEAVGKRKFLSKERDDRTEHSLGVGKDLTVGGNLASDNFVQGNTMGSGWSVYRDANGNFVVETDRMIVRKDMFVNELVVNQETYNKGSIIYVKAGCTITRVKEDENYYRCYYDNQGKSRYSGFVVGDQARCQRYDQSYKDLVKYYWRLVVGVGDDFVDLSKTDKDGIGMPEEGDDIAQLGNRNDKTRQSAIVISPDNGGSVVVWAGIDSFELSNKNMVGMGVNNNTGRAYLYGYGDMYFGDRNLEGNFITYQIKDGDTEPTLRINADVHLGKDSTGLSNLSEFKSVEDEIQHIQENVNILGVDVGIIKEQVDREFTIWYFDPIPTLENEPAINWNTDELKTLHDQDIYFSDVLARAWRFVNGEWIEITDERTLAALKMAEAAESAAQEALDASREVKSYIENVLPSELADLQKQIDGQLESYFYKYDPTLENEPASLWVTDEQKAAHLNDTFTNLDNGYSWRWTVDNEVYGWIEIADTATSKALLAAGKAQDTADGKRRVFVKEPTTPYDIGDLWVQGELGDILRCAKDRTEKEKFESSDWVKASKYTDDTALNDFINGDYKKQLDKINQQIDERAETWYQEEDPSLAWDTEELKQLHVGDLWYDKTRGQSFMWTGSEWITQGVPDEVFDTIDGKASIYTSQPSSYNKNDLWVLSEDTTLDATYKAGTIVIATESSEVFVKEHWTKKDSYTDDTEADKANARLESWASDGSISPTEKTALKQQKLDIQGEYNSLLISAITYGIDVESFSEAYELAIAALAKYTASTPENITIGYDYQHIEAYYQARQELRASIDAAIKMESDKAYKEAVEAKGDAKTIKEDVDGIQADMDIIKEQTDKEYVIWYFDHEPTLKNEPAIHWTTEELIKMHDQDLFFSDATGNAWRFVNGQWEPITDERTIVALREAKEAKQGVADLEYLKNAFDMDERVLEDGILMGKVVAVNNNEGDIEAFLNGSDFANDDTHGKLLLAGGIPEGDGNLESRARNAATKIYEDGTMYSRKGVFDNAVIKGTLRTPWKRIEYKLIYTSADGDVYGYDGSAIDDDKVMIAPVMTAELKISWGDDADGRDVAVRVDAINNASVYILVPEGCFALNHEGTKIVEGEKLILNPGYIYYLTGFSNCWVVKQRVSFNV